MQESFIHESELQRFGEDCLFQPIGNVRELQICPLFTYQ